MKREDFERAKWLPICIIAVILMIVYKTIDNLTQITSAISRFLWVVSPLLYGILFAYFLYIPHSKLEKLISKIKPKFISKRARGVSTIIVFFLLIFIIVFIISYISPILINSIIDLANSIPGYILSTVEYFNNMPDDSIWTSLNIAALLRDYSGDIVNIIFNPAGIEQLARGFVSFVGEIFNLILGLVVSLYLLLERESIIEYFRRLNNAVFKSDRARTTSVRYLNQINNVLFTFIASKGLDSVINLVTVTSILLILKVPYALLLGLIAGLFNFIPYLGSIIAVFVICLITLITGDISKMIQVFIPLIIFQQLDGNYIEPRIMKSSLKISPVLVIIAVVIGGAYLGIAGMFLAVPIAVIIKQLLLEYMHSSEYSAQEDSTEIRR